MGTSLAPASCLRGKPHRKVGRQAQNQVFRSARRKNPQRAALNAPIGTRRWSAPVGRRWSSAEGMSPATSPDRVAFPLARQTYAPASDVFETVAEAPDP